MYVLENVVVIDYVYIGEIIIVLLIVNIVWFYCVRYIYGLKVLCGEVDFVYNFILYIYSCE